MSLRQVPSLPVFHKWGFRSIRQWNPTCHTLHGFAELWEPLQWVNVWWRDGRDGGACTVERDRLETWLWGQAWKTLTVEQVFNPMGSPGWCEAAWSLSAYTHLQKHGLASVLPWLWARIDTWDGEGSLFGLDLLKGSHWSGIPLRATYSLQILVQKYSIKFSQTKSRNTSKQSSIMVK